MINWMGELKSFLAIFYITDPRDTVPVATAFASDQARNILILTILEFAILTLWHQRRHVHRNGEHARPYMFNDAFSSLAATLLEIQFLSVAYSTFPSFPWAWDRRIMTLTPGTWQTWIIATLGYEFCYYWFHRCMHEVSLLWMLHRVHHDSQDLNMTTGARRHIFTAYSVSLFFIPLTLIGVPSEVMYLHSILNGTWQVWCHTQVIPKQFWIIEFLFNTASHHRVHHGRNPYCLDKNYGGFLIIYDRLFGTFAEERDSEPVVYGVTTPLLTANPVSTQIIPIIELARRVIRTPWPMKPLPLILGPGWTPEKPHLRLGDPNDVPRVPNLIEMPHALATDRFEYPLTWITRSYLIYNLYLIIFAHFLFIGDVFDFKPWSATASWFMYTFASFGCMGLIWDGHLMWGFIAEALRWAVGIYVLCVWADGADPSTFLLLCSGFAGVAYCLIAVIVMRVNAVAEAPKGAGYASVSVVGDDFSVPMVDNSRLEDSKEM